MTLSIVTQYNLYTTLGNRALGNIAQDPTNFNVFYGTYTIPVNGGFEIVKVTKNQGVAPTYEILGTIPWKTGTPCDTGVWGMGSFGVIDGNYYCIGGGHPAKPYMLIYVRLNPFAWNASWTGTDNSLNKPVILRSGSNRYFNFHAWMPGNPRPWSQLVYTGNGGQPINGQGSAGSTWAALPICTDQNRTGYYVSTAAGIYFVTGNKAPPTVAASSVIVNPDATYPLWWGIEQPWQPDGLPSKWVEVGDKRYFFALGKKTAADVKYYWYCLDTSNNTCSWTELFTDTSQGAAVGYNIIQAFSINDNTPSPRVYYCVGSPSGSLGAAAHRTVRTAALDPFTPYASQPTVTGFDTGTYWTQHIISTVNEVLVFHSGGTTFTNQGLSILGDTEFTPLDPPVLSCNSIALKNVLSWV
jgi:hypothetical protein